MTDLFLHQKGAVINSCKPGIKLHAVQLGQQVETSLRATKAVTVPARLEGLMPVNASEVPQDPVH